MHELTLLLVDDHEAFLNAAQRELRPHGWLKVLGRALNGREAVMRTEELRPAVVVMDLAMPEMGGLQATRLIKAQDEPPFVIIASHFDDAEHREHAHAAGADAFIGKSDYAKELLPILERFAAERSRA
jgi:NarL family two-component system response regulator LiaR